MARQRRFVDRERGVERDLPLQTGLRVLVQELYARRARIEHEDCIGLGGPRLGEFGREVELIRPFGELLAEHLSLEGGRHTREHILAGGVIRADQEGALHALLVHVKAHGLRRLVVLP